MGFDPGFKRPTCLATLKSSDRTKKSVREWQYDNIYLSIYLSLSLYIYIGVSATLGFMPYTYVRRGERFSKKPIEMVNFYLKVDFICGKVFVGVLMLVCLWIFCRSHIHIYVYLRMLWCASWYIYTYFRCLLFGKIHTTTCANKYT